LIVSLKTKLDSALESSNFCQSKFTTTAQNTVTQWANC